MATFNPVAQRPKGRAILGGVIRDDKSLNPQTFDNQYSRQLSRSLRRAAVLLADRTAANNSGTGVHHGQCGFQHAATNIVKIQTHSRRTGAFDRLKQPVGAIINAVVKTQSVSGLSAFINATSDANHIVPQHFGNLPDKAAH